MSPLYSIQTVKNERELTFALAIRAIVFVEEQACPFSEEFDDYDSLQNTSVQHFLIMHQNEPVATARTIYVNDSEAKIGRIAVLKAFRSQGLATELIKHMIKTLTVKAYIDISIHAQAHLEAYYEQFGFKKCSDTFDEAGISHIKMKYYEKRVERENSQ